MSAHDVYCSVLSTSGCGLCRVDVASVSSVSDGVMGGPSISSQNSLMSVRLFSLPALLSCSSMPMI